MRRPRTVVPRMELACPSGGGDEKALVRALERGCVRNMLQHEPGGLSVLHRTEEAGSETERRQQLAVRLGLARHSAAMAVAAAGACRARLRQDREALAAGLAVDDEGLERAPVVVRDSAVN